MKYVCIDDGAVAELISGRRLQSIDFEDGARLVDALTGAIEVYTGIGQIIVTFAKDGMFFSTEGRWKAKRYIIIDCETSRLFSSGLKKGETLVSFQKLLRFCSKYWNKGVFNNAEKIITGTTKAIVFPQAFSSNSKFRIAIEREPLKERLAKREMDGHFLLVYKSGTEGADSATEAVDLANFRKAFDALSNIYKSLGQKIETLETASRRAAQHQQLSETRLDTVSPNKGRSIFLPYNDWMELITRQQHRFIFAESSKPHRLVGPAGTGKTLALLLRTIRILKESDERNGSCGALFVTHSEATRQAILEILSVVDADQYYERDPRQDTLSLSVFTLASLCASTLSQTISATEFVDRDAQDSKLLQEMYIEQAIDQAKDSDYKSHRPHLSERFRSFFESKPSSELAPLFQHEISVLIKGRSGDSFDVYRKCPPLKYGLPTENDADKGLVHTIFRLYQDQLESTNQFDTDDVVLSAIGQLDTPIWRRRRAKEGYDFIAVDETHLFNINELHVFHHFSRKSGSYPISFSVDKAQAVGDRGWGESEIFEEIFDGDVNERSTTAVKSIFRSSPEIIDFSTSILASGAILFTNFENTLLGAQSVFTGDEERRSQPLRYIECSDDEQMVDRAFGHADSLASNTGSKKWEVLITSLSPEICADVRAYAEQRNKPVTYLERRGDFAQVEHAKRDGHFVVGHADYVGGLEFNVVLILGVDKGRVPFEGTMDDANSRNFASYSAHNRLYVASSRARFALALFGVIGRGPSDILDAAFLSNLISKVTA